MEELRLPRSNKEGLIYGAIISALSCLLIGGYNMVDQLGLSWDTARSMVVALPIIWILVMFYTNLVVIRITNWICNRYIAPTDSVNARLLANLVPTVFIMSFTFSLVGPFVGSLISMIGGANPDFFSILDHHRFIWPRNFFIATLVELCIAQPAARRCMVHIHRKAMASNA